MSETYDLVHSTLAERYMQNTPLEHRKKYAQFFTPNKIADIMSDWLLKNKHLNIVLDPAFGLGVFAEKMTEKCNINIKGFEIDSFLYKIAKNVFNDNANIELVLQDYMFNDWDNKYDGIICNPPYMKFHDYDNKTVLREFENRFNYKLSGMSNLYVLFLLKSLYQLNDNGFLAYIIPSEFLNSDYGVKIKEILVSMNVLRHIAVIDFNTNIFGDAITTATILLCAKDCHSDFVNFSTIRNIDELNKLKLWICEYPDVKNINQIIQKNLNPDVKWRKYYQKENAKKYKNLTTFNAFAKVKRGIATGANDFFVFNKSKQYTYSLPDRAMYPCICKSADVVDIFFTNKNFESLKNKDKNIYILDAELAINDSSVQKYLHKGEVNKIHNLYLTSKRTPWYAIEKREIAPIWVSVFHRNGIKFVRNETNIKNLTTFHGVYPNSILINVDILFAYLTTNIAREIFDDARREYGNGLKKFEPNDLNKALCANLSLIDSSSEKQILSLLYEYRDDRAKTNNLSKINDIFSDLFLA